ncbi:nuclear transport factor 2 family protein [Nonomuraea sp. NPDC050310]|uniref:nuclear transport factor 2 family protein n=1 Tax=Nonomuraea sp. NPDC050310 TaxID=3154935 RepID=UPI0033ECF511
MNPRQAAQHFADTWQHGWSTHDVDTIAALYHDEAVHTSMPFRPPHHGKTQITDYIRRSFHDETNPRARFAVPLVDGNHAAIEYHVTTDQATLSGCVFVTFDPDGLARTTRDYWHESPNATDLTHAPGE